MLAVSSRSVERQRPVDELTTPLRSFKTEVHVTDWPAYFFLSAIVVLRGSARRSSLKGRERATVNQKNSGTISNVTGVGETFERWDGAHIMVFSGRSDATELNRCYSQI